jgi:lipoate-protein ligase A
VDYDNHRKIVGCAQRRVGSAVLQQMSVLGMSDNGEFVAALRDSMYRAFGVDRWTFVDSQMALCYTGPISTDATVQGREQL